MFRFALYYHERNGEENKSISVNVGYVAQCIPIIGIGRNYKKKHLIYGWNSLNKQFYPNIQKVNFDSFVEILFSTTGIYGGPYLIH